MARIPDSLVFGSSYRESIAGVDLGLDCLAENLITTLRYAQVHTAYGREVIPNGITLKNVFDVYDSLPVIDADDVAGNLDYYKSDAFSAINSYVTTTGGTGRNPSKVSLSNRCYGIEWAHILNMWGSAGYQRSRFMKLTLRGKSLKPGKLLQYNPIYNEVVADFFQVGQHNFEEFFEQLKSYPVRCIHGYPSLVREFLHYLKNRKLTYSVDLIFLGSEGASIELKEELKSFFCAQVVSWYGQTEKVILAADFKGDGHFVNYASYGFPSIESADATGFGELLGTTFVNRALPLIKYRTGDFARINETAGHLVIKDIQGRWGKDFVYLNAEKKIPTTSINLHGSLQERILFYQLVQREYGKVQVRLLPESIADEGVADQLRAELLIKLQGFKIDVHCVTAEKIDRSKRGKMIMLVQHIKEV
ncbi:AMP-binding protein [Akkermansiaceae bacterium]|nr:AMP-binding protein [Akkermansiaceae bacterium]